MLKIPNNRARPGALYPRPERVFSFVYGKITNYKKALQYKKRFSPPGPPPAGRTGMDKNAVFADIFKV
jgi:hypothetical protein